jgi:hypothetical protein
MYGDGSGWQGEIFTDTVGLGHGTPNVSLELVSISTENQFFDQTTFQGILGLGPSQLEEPGTDSYVSQIVAAGLPQVIAFELCASGGTMWLGGYDGSATASAMQYTPLLPIDSARNPFYAINIDDIAVGGKSLGFQASAFKSPIVDTGTSLFYLPTPIFDAMVKAINTSSGFASVFGTQQISQTTGGGGGCVSARGMTAAAIDAALPALAVKMPSAAAGASDFTLSLQPTQSYLFDAGGGTFCLAAGDAGTTMGILGDSFLSAFLVVIDRASGRVGFAPEAGCAGSVGRRVVDLATWRPRPPRRR